MTFQRQSVLVCPWAPSLALPLILLWLWYSRACFLGHSFQLDDLLFPRRWSVISSSSVMLCSLRSHLLLSPYHWQVHNQIGIRCVTGLGTIYHRALEKEHNKALWGHSSSALSNHHSTFPPLIEGYSVFSLSKNTCNLHFYLRVQALFHILSSSITFYKKHSLIYFYAVTSANSLRDIIGYF